MSLEHGHVITLTHFGDMAYVVCACGTISTVMKGKYIGNWITNHRLDYFIKLRNTLKVS